MAKHPLDYFFIFIVAMLATTYGLDLTLGIQKTHYSIDVVEHTMGGMMLALFAYHYLERGFLDTVAFAVLGGVFWEFWEFVPITAGWWGMECQYEDTIIDLICDTIGALIIAIGVRA